MSNNLNIAEAYENDKKLPYIVKTDMEAEQVLDALRERTEEYNRVTALCQAKIEQLQDKIEQEKSSYEWRKNELEMLLRGYWLNGLQGQPSESKIQFKYKLATGDLVLKKEKHKLEATNELIDYLQKNDLTDYIKIESKPKWGEFKEQLTLKGNKVIYNVTGEVVDCVTIKHEPERFEVKL